VDVGNHPHTSPVSLAGDVLELLLHGAQSRVARAGPRAHAVGGDIGRHFRHDLGSCSRCSSARSVTDTVAFPARRWSTRSETTPRLVRSGSMPALGGRWPAQVAGTSTRPSRITPSGRVPVGRNTSIDSSGWRWENSCSRVCDDQAAGAKPHGESPQARCSRRAPGAGTPSAVGQQLTGVLPTVPDRRRSARLPGGFAADEQLHREFLLQRPNLAESTGWAMCSCSAARPKLRCSATATK